MNKQTDFKQELSLKMTILALGVGSLIGGGLFGLTGIAVGYSGPSFLVVIALLALINLPTVMAYAELGLSIPDTGGGYAWIKMAYGSALGHFAGWGSWGAHTVACAVYALNIGYYTIAIMVHYLPYGKEISSQLELFLPISAPTLVGVIFIGGLAIINLLGARSTGRFGMYLVVALIAILIIYVVLGLVNMFIDIEATQQNFTDFFPKGGWGVILAMGNFAIAYQGSEIVAQAVKEIKDPKKNLKKALFISYGIIVGIYLAVIFAALAGTHAEISSWETLKNAGEGAIAKSASFFSWAWVLVPLIFGAGFAASLAALNSTIFSSSHAAVALSRAKSIPHEIGKLSSRGTPKVAIVLSAGGMVFMIVSLPLEEVAAVANLLFIFLFLWLNAALIKLRISFSEIARPYKVPMFPWLNILAIIGYIIVATPLFSVMSAKGLLIVLIWFSIGIFLWFLFAKRNIEDEVERATIYRAFIPLGAEIQAKVFCPLMKGTDWRTMLRFAHSIAVYQHTGICVCLLQDLPQGITSFQEFQRDSAEKATMRKAAMSFCDEVVRELESYPDKVSLSFISTGVTDEPPSFEQIERFTYERMIAKLIEIEDFDVLMMPFERIERWKRGFAWSTLTRVLRQASCHLMVVKTSFTQKDFFKEGVKCLVPYSHNPHTRLLLDTLLALRLSFGRRFSYKFIHVCAQNESSKSIAQLSRELVSYGILEPEIEINFLGDLQSIPELVLEIARDYDMVLLSASSEKSFQEIEFGHTAEEVLERAIAPAIVVHRHQEFWHPVVVPLISWWRKSNRR